MKIALVAFLAAFLAACGTAANSNPAPPSGLATANVKYTQTGSTDATVMTTTVSLQLDSAGFLSIHVTLKSNVDPAETFTVTAKLSDTSGKLLSTAGAPGVTLANKASTDLYLLGSAETAPATAIAFDVEAAATPSPSPTPTATPSPSAPSSPVATASPASSPGTATSPPQKPSSPKLLIALIVLLIVGGGGAYWYFKRRGMGGP